MKTPSNKTVPKGVVERYNKLKKTIKHHNHLYHTLDSPEVSDEVFDSLVRELSMLESRYLKLKSIGGFADRVGGEPIETFKKVKHKVRQYSFDNVFTFDELKQWEEKVFRILSKALGEAPSSLEYCTELKIDGLKIILTYEKGGLKIGATRGDGVTGEDVTHNIKTIKSIPLKLEKPADVVAVGEAWLSESELERINSGRKKKDEPLFANARNAAAGSLRQLDPKIAAGRRLESFIYDLDLIEKRQARALAPTTQIEELELLQSLGFQVNPYYKLCRNLDEVEKYYQEWVKRRGKQPYHVDGVVVKVNEVEFQKTLGRTAKAPRFAVAYKFPAEQVTTVVEDIMVQVGRTGVLTPVAHLKPVHVGGAIVSRATLHNEDFISELDIRVGDTVILQRAGDVIPEVVEVVKDIRSGRERKWKFPRKVPTCGGDGSVERIPGQAAYRCKHKGGFEEQKRKLEHFVSKKAFDIEGLGKEQVKIFLEEGLISDFADIFTLREGDLLPLERFAEKSVENLLESINKSREVSLARLLVGFLNCKTFQVDHDG